VKVEKHVAIIGFNVCMAVFVALSALGIFSYMSWDDVQAPTVLIQLLYGIGVAGSIVGICFFGIQMDRRRLEESKKR
jgi:hypothetical protein